MVLGFQELEKNIAFARLRKRVKFRGIIKNCIDKRYSNRGWWTDDPWSSYRA